MQRLYVTFQLAVVQPVVATLSRDLVTVGQEEILSLAFAASRIGLCCLLAGQEEDEIEQLSFALEGGQSLAEVLEQGEEVEQGAFGKSEEDSSSDDSASRASRRQSVGDSRKQSVGSRRGSAEDDRRGSRRIPQDDVTELVHRMKVSGQLAMPPDLPSRRGSILPDPTVDFCFPRIDLLYVGLGSPCKLRSHLTAGGIKLQGSDLLITYQVSPRLPLGLDLDLNGAIEGSPDEIAAMQTYCVTAHIQPRATLGTGSRRPSLRMPAEPAALRCAAKSTSCVTFAVVRASLALLLNFPEEMRDTLGQLKAAESRVEYLEERLDVVEAAPRFQPRATRHEPTRRTFAALSARPIVPKPPPKPPRGDLNRRRWTHAADGADPFHITQMIDPPPGADQPWSSICVAFL